jgi:hypothetical protein
VDRIHINLYLEGSIINREEGIEEPSERAFVF